jgi:hypothetical protein
MFIKTKAELEVQQMKTYNKEQEDIKHIKAFIASCGTYSNLVRQVGTQTTTNTSTVSGAPLHHRAVESTRVLGGSASPPV